MKKPSRFSGVALRLVVLAGLAAAGVPASAEATTRPAAPVEVAQPAPAAPKPAPAPTAKVELLVLHATNAGKGIDPALGDVPELKKPPFSSYDTYKLLEQSELTLEKDKASSKGLPDKGTLSLTFKDVLAGAKPGEPSKYALTASITKPDNKPFLPSLGVNANANERFFIAGQRYDGGILVIVLRVR